MFKLFNSLSFSKKYVFALSLIALFSVLAYINLSQLINSQANDGEIINISGRQRMLSQKTALFAVENKIKKLKDTATLMEESHNLLMQREMSEKLFNLYFSKPANLDKRVKSYIYNAKFFLNNNDKKSLTYVLENSQIILNYLDKAVYFYQIEAEEKIKRLKNNEFYIVFFTLLTLLMEAVFIFRPANNRINKKTKEIVSERNYSNTIIESNTNAIIAVSKDLKVHTFNKNAEIIFGYTKKEMIEKKSLHLIIPDKYLKAHSQGIENFMRTGIFKNNDNSLEFEGKRKNGEIFPLRISFGASDGRNRIIIANIQDITKEKEKDRLLLQQSRVAALGEMIGNIAHQWRQPLSSIRIIASGAKIRRKSNLISDEEIDDAFVKIAEHTQFLSQTIDDFRNFLSQDKSEIIFIVRDIIKKAINLTEATYKSNNIKIETDFIDEELKCNGESSKLAQVFLNILSNAKDILIGKEIDQKIVFVELKKEENFAVVYISDNAGGIPDKIMPKIFDPYFTTKHKAQGTGVGLFMSQEIMERHMDGMISASNKNFTIDGVEYFGAKFCVKMPLLEKDAIFKTTACPLDCYDACEVHLINGKLKGSKTHPVTNGKLCNLFSYLDKQEIIKTKFSIDEIKKNLIEKLSQANPQKVLFYKGSGNLGVMQNTTKIFFDKYGATVATGSLCDKAGADGIKENRKYAVNPPLKNLINSDVVIVWGRNLTVTSPHIYNLVKDKEIIVIDPIETQIAKEAKLYLQIKPKTDYILALLLSGLAHIEELEDKNFVKNCAENLDDFYNFARSSEIKKGFKQTGIKLDVVGDLLYTLSGKSVSILVGVGVQKYIEGQQIMRCIDGFAGVLGLFNKESGGLWYLGDSMYPYAYPFKADEKNKIAKPDVDFGDFDVCFIQGANPAVTAPNTKKVIEGLKKTFVIFFGTTNNETAQYADLIIPSKTFLQKKDIRLSYAHDEIIKTQKLQENENAISEYELTKFLFEEFKMSDLKTEEAFLASFDDIKLQKPRVNNFNFINKIEVKDLGVNDNKFYLITAKSKNSLNSQFEVDNYIYLNPKLGFENGQTIKAVTKIGSSEFVVKTTYDLRKDCVLLHSGAKNVNLLTPDYKSQYGENATFQEIVVELFPV